MKLLGLLGLLVAAVSALVVDPDIHQAFKNGEKVDLFVHFPQFKRSEMGIQQVLTRAEGRQRVFEERSAHNAKFQPKLLSLLSESLPSDVEIKTFWITNSILIKNVNPKIVDLVSKFPGVVELEMDKDTAHIIDPMTHDVFDSVERYILEWNVDLIGAPKAWETADGKGVVVANIDTGVRYTHESVRDNYRGNLGGGSYDHDYNWHDPRGQTVPFDNNGHGTHTMGTMAGSRGSGIGVAPGSLWIAAKGCASSSCSTSDLISSAEYVVCPTRQGGGDRDCSKGADLVNNSWGGGRGSSTYLTYIQAWVDAGMVPLFSQGNSGSSCSTANSPGDLAIVIGVGSTNKNDNLSSFSSRGPGVGTSTHPLQKPDIAAPGESVRSAYYTSDTAYATLSGTSMACPAAAGVVALMLSANPRLSVDQVREILINTAVQGLPAPNGGQTTCSGVSYTTYPNYHYGHGRVDALKAVETSFAQ